MARKKLYSFQTAKKKEKKAKPHTDQEGQSVQEKSDRNQKGSLEETNGLKVPVDTKEKYNALGNSKQTEKVGTASRSSTESISDHTSGISVDIVDDVSYPKASNVEVAQIDSILVPNRGGDDYCIRVDMADVPKIEVVTNGQAQGVPPVSEQPAVTNLPGKKNIFGISLDNTIRLNSSAQSVVPHHVGGNLSEGRQLFCFLNWRNSVCHSECVEVMFRVHIQRSI